MDLDPGTPADPTGLRRLYLDTATLVVHAVGLPEVVAAWDGPSSLPLMTVGELASHIGRSVLQVEHFLDQPQPHWPTPVSAASYYAVLEGTAEPESTLNQGVRRRSIEVASLGPDAALALVTACRDRLAQRLVTEPADRQVLPHGDRALTLDDYLRTRLVEICIHRDDLALSLPDAPIGRPRPEAVAVAVDVLFRAARERNGDDAVLLALSRRERDRTQALRVL
jgi:hypothetical protein